MASEHSSRVLVLIGVTKLARSPLLILVAVGAFSSGVRHRIEALQPSNHGLQSLLVRFLDLSPHTVTMIAIAALIYAALFLIEGVGLLLERVWAEYFTTAVTMSFLPLEVYEMSERASVVNASVIAMNVAIVIYLVARVKHRGRWPFRRRSIAVGDDRNHAPYNV